MKWIPAPSAPRLRSGQALPFDTSTLRLRSVQAALSAGYAQDFAQDRRGGNENLDGHVASLLAMTGGLSAALGVTEGLFLLVSATNHEIVVLDPVRNSTGLEAARSYF